MSLPPVSPTTVWLAPAEWLRIQSAIPITCVDVLPFQGTNKRRLGLILRETPDNGRKWCLIGGRLFRGETFAAAIHRQVEETLGSDAHAMIGQDPQPDYVAQYLPTPRVGFGYDPRQHAVGLTFCTHVTGKINPQGEAVEFAWYAIDKLPEPGEIGFQQDSVILSCASRLRDGPPDSGHQETER